MRSPPTPPTHRRTGHVVRRVVVSIGRPVLVALVVVAFGYGVVRVLVSDPQRTAVPRPAVRHVQTVGPGGDAGPTQGQRWTDVLRHIDRHRARAWATGRPALLRAVYAEGSPLLVEDAAMLRRYVARGLDVGGVRLRYLSVAVVRQRSDHVRLLVVDRLGAAVARDAAGGAYPLPHDRPTRQLIDLVAAHGRWRIASVR